MTLLGGMDLKPANWFHRGGNSKRDSSVDLTIGKMFNEGGDDLGEKWLLKPGEMVLVTTEDVFKLPNNVTAFVSCKTTLTHQGVWAITVGIVDPCFVGPISTTLVNFGSEARLLQRGDAFLRAAFFSHAPSNPICPDPDPDQETNAYLRKAQGMSVRFSKTFLDQAMLAERAGKVASDRLRNGALWWATLMALLFTAMQVAGVAADRYVFSPGLIASTAGKDSELDRRLDGIEAQIHQLQGTSSQPQSAPVAPVRQRTQGGGRSP